ncbi:MAG TPA: cyclodeaminase/cyclohydrolase family protein [Vicinamibacterales bacterium]|jgi:formiminotetrahydrofolate cyclodeaminase|nr:cyclodeaminase/cyclohydrolase family protein [Vicinamibacterales bacterium]
MKLTALSVSELLSAFRSSEPTPGGGSASALASAVGASLLAMVAALPKPRTTTDENVARLAEAGRGCTALALQLEALIDQDSAAYDLVVGAFRLPKSTDDEKTARAGAIQKALIAATEAPLEVMRRSSAALALSSTVNDLGNQNATSDVRVAIGLLRAGLQGARHNVEINLGSVKDPGYVERVREESARLSESA